MSKDKLKIEDIFHSNEDKDKRIYFINKHKNCYEILVSDKREVLDIKEWFYLKNDYTIGKSKVNIEQLFEVENEE